MVNTQKISIVLTFMALCGSFLFNICLQLIIAFVLIFSLGIVHGANDIQIIRKVQSNNESFFKLVGLYTLTVILVGIVFFLLPKVALTVFVLISAYHFGEQHFHKLNIQSNFLKYAFFGSYGLTILCSLFYFNSELSSEVIEQIATVKLNQSQFLWTALVSIFILIITGLYINMKGGLKSWFIEVFYLVVLFILFNYSSLIWGFAIYFVIWHSLPSLLEQVKFLNGSINKQSILDYIKSSLIYWIMSIVGLSAFVFFFKDNDKLFLTLFFTFLAAITFPHVVVMHKLFKDNGLDH